jgi:hypothetical protein
LEEVISQSGVSQHPAYINIILATDSILKILSDWWRKKRADNFRSRPQLARLSVLGLTSGSKLFIFEVLQ